MNQVKDKGALLCAMVAIVLALVSWLRADASRSQQIADLGVTVGRIEHQVDTMQGELDSYLHLHDGR